MKVRNWAPTKVSSNSETGEGGRNSLPSMPPSLPKNAGDSAQHASFSLQPWPTVKRVSVTGRR